MIDRGSFLGGVTAALAAPTTLNLPNFTQTLSIAVVCPLSGPYTKAGEQLVNGVRAAIDEANQLHFSTTNKAYTIRTFDDANQVANALVNAQFAITDQSQLAVIGHLGAQTTSAVVRTYAEAGMPLLVPASTYDNITAQGYRNVFRLPTSDFTEGQLLAKYVFQTYAPKNAHALVQDGDYGSDVASGWVSQMNAQKIPNAFTQFSFAKPDYDAAVTAALAAKPDHITLAGNVADMGPALALLRTRGYTGPIAASQGFFDGLTLSKYASAAEGLVIATSMPYLAIAPSAYRPVSDYEARYGQLTPLSAFAYAATQIVISVMQRTGASARNTLLSALQTTGSYNTIVGTFSFGTTGDPIDPNLYFYAIKSGKLTYVRQAHPSGFLPK
jgi:branched-chain amino acid transport system substrate-binding protein